MPQELEVIRQERINGGQQAYWRCPTCESLREALYVLDGVLACRVCHKLSYRSRVLQKHRAVLRVAKLRTKLGAGPSMLSPLPSRPKHNMQAARYDRLARELAKQERVLVELLGATVKALERREGRLHGPR